MDQTDLTILTHLQNDGRRSFSDIARALQVSVGTVRNRVTRMLADETVNIVGRVNPNKVGFDAYASIFISIRPSELIASTAAELATFPEVTFLAEIVGEFDLQVDVMCKDNEHLSRLISDRLHKTEGVNRTTTMMILQVHKYGQADLNLLLNGPEDGDEGADDEPRIAYR